jgi:hypothetical protein
MSLIRIIPICTIHLCFTLSSYLYSRLLAYSEADRTAQSETKKSHCAVIGQRIRSTVPGMMPGVRQSRIGKGQLIILTEVALGCPNLVDSPSCGSLKQQISWTVSHA